MKENTYAQHTVIVVVLALFISALLMAGSRPDTCLPLTFQGVVIQ